MSGCVRREVVSCPWTSPSTRLPVRSTCTRSAAPPRPCESSRGQRSDCGPTTPTVAREPARDWGASAAIPFFGGMTSTDRVVTLQDPLPDTTWIYEVDRDRNTVAIAARHSEHRVELPVEPMLGTVGVAPLG